MSSSSQIDFNKNNFLDYFSEDKPEPITKIKSKTFKDLKKIAMNRIHQRYGAKAKLKYQYIGHIMENLIFNKNTHLVSTFKDYMIWDYVEEFLKRFYNNKESGERVPKFASFYKNYLKFFCIPTFKDIYCNEMIHNYTEKKAELFYNENYRKKKENNSYQEDYGIFEESESDEESDSKTSNNNIEKTIFNETVKKKIERYSPINTSMALPESDTKLKPDDSGLLITSSNETSLVSIMKGMIPPPSVSKIKKNKNPQNPKNNNKKNINNKSSNNNTNNSHINNNNHQGENSSSYRLSQKNLMSSTLNKFNNQTLETLLNSQLKNKNKNSGLTNKKSDKINSKENNTHTNSNNGPPKSQVYNNTNNKNKNKIASYMGIYKKKSIPKSRNENKLSEDMIKPQTKSNNFMSATYNLNNNNNNQNIINIKNNVKNITSINNYNLNYKQSLQKSRNQQQSISINSNTYSKYSVDKVNNVKKKINKNLLKNNNIEFILNQLKVHPLCTLKKSATKKIIHNISNSNNANYKKEEKNSPKKSKILSVEHGMIKLKNEYGRNSSKYRTINNKNQNNDIRPYSHHNHKYENSPLAFDFLKKSSTKLIKGNFNIRPANSKDTKLNKKTRNFSYNESQKSEYDEKNKNRNTINNNKMSFDRAINNNLNKNSTKKSHIINNNGTKHIHNVNININNQINIGGKQFNELFSFTDLVKKNNINSSNKNIYSMMNNKNKKNNYISRNKNQSLDFNQYTNNPSHGANSIRNSKMNSISDIQSGNNNMYKTHYKNGGFSGNGTITNHKNKEAKKIRLTNNALFRSMKAINNNYNHKK